MDNYWLLAPSVAFALLWRRERQWRQAWYKGYGDLMAENKQLEAQLADRDEAIADLNKQILALHQQTAPMAQLEAKPAPRRTRTPKKAAE